MQIIYENQIIHSILTRQLVVTTALTILNSRLPCKTVNASGTVSDREFVHSDTVKKSSERAKFCCLLVERVATPCGTMKSYSVSDLLPYVS